MYSIKQGKEELGKKELNVLHLQLVSYYEKCLKFAIGNAQSIRIV